MTLKWLFASVDNQKNRVRKAARAVSERRGNVAAESYMVEFYKSQAAATDPRTDWWAYAQFRQAQADSEHDLAVEERRLATANAKLTAHQLKLEKIK